MSILIKNGQVIDPATQKDEISDVLIENGVITRVEKGIRVKDAQVIDAKGCYVMPGIIDMHVHLRDPGQTYKEDIESGSKAAAKGGVTTLVAMPNTKPVIDSPDRVNYVTIKADRFSPINVLQAGAITVGQKGEELADIEGMVKAGIPAISEDGKSVMNALLYKEAMEIAAEKNIPVLAHCEDKNLVNGGCMNEDANSREWHLPGITNSVENTIVARDIVLAAETGAHLHLCHCSTKESVDMVREARKAGVSISAEVCPHHFTLCSDDIVKGDTNYKMNPPLRTKEDLEALRQGLKDDVFDVISTDHAPHALTEKQESFKKAPFGIVGLETSVALTITELVDTEIITPMQMATAVAAIANGGYLVTPYVVDSISDKDGNIISQTETNIRRQVISEEVSRQLLAMMENNVHGAGDYHSCANAYVAGYRIGGKSGTAERTDRHLRGDGDYYKMMSFAAVLPIDDPEIEVFVLLDDPRWVKDYASQVVAPVVGNIISEIAPYLGIEQDADYNPTGTVTVQTCLNYTWTNAQVTLNRLGLKHKLIGPSSGNIVYQYPVGGSVVPAGSTIYLYTATDQNSMTTTPDVVGKTGTFAEQMLKAANLNVQFAGDSGGKVVAQDVEAGTSAAYGTIITLTMDSGEDTTNDAPTVTEEIDPANEEG